MTTRSVGRILVVDDEVELKNILVEALTSQGYEVSGFTSGEEALVDLRGEAFDILLTDLMMPGMDGITLVCEALQIDPHLVCMVMTGQGTIQTAVDAMKVGAFDYVLKPFRLQTVLPVLTRAMNTRHMRLENLQLRETVAIYELGQTIAFTLDPQTVISKLADAALQQTDADEVSVLLPVSDGSDELYVAAVRGKNRQRLLGERVPLDESISGWVVREREPLILDGEVNDQRFRSMWPHPEIRSAISIPMQVAGKLVGTININALNRPRPFTLGQMKALTILASTAAAALESASLYGQVRRAEENYRSIFENAVEGIFQSTPEGRFITVNPALARILGYDSPEEVVARVTDIARQVYVHSEVRRTSEEIESREGVLRGFEFEAYRKDGEKIWLSLNRRTIHDENGVILYHEGSVEDIDEGKRAEEALRASQQLIEGIINTIPVRVFWKDKNLSYLGCNAIFAHDAGLSDPIEIIGKDDYQLAWREHADLYRDDDQEVIETGSSKFLIEEPQTTADGKAVTLLTSKMPLRNSSGEIGGVLGTYIDITERKRIEEALKSSEAEMRALFASMTDLILVLDSEGRYLKVAPTKTHNIYRPDTARVGKTIHEVFPREIADLFLNEIRSALEAGSTRRIEYSLTIGDEDFWFDGSVSPMTESTVVWVARDITERKLAEEERARLAAEIESQRQRLDNLVAAVPGVVWEAWGQPDAATQRIDFVSDHVEAMLGYSVEEWLSTPNFWLQIVHPDDRERVAKEAAAAFASVKTIYTMEFRWVAKDERALWVESTSTVIKDAEGRPVGVRGVTVDISERKRSEAVEARRAVHALFRGDVSAALAGHKSPLHDTLKLCAEAMVRHLNAAFARVWTFNGEESVLELQASAGLYTHTNGAHARVPLGSFKIGRIAEQRRPHISNDVANDPEVSDRDWAAREGMVAFAGYPLIVEDRLLGVMALFSRAVLEDDTLDALASVADIVSQGIERQRAEAGLRESEERYRALFESNPYPMWVFDLESLRFLAVNDAAVSHYGYSRGEFLRLTIAEIRPPEDIPQLMKDLQSQAVGGIAESRHCKKDGTVIEVEISSQKLAFGKREAQVVLALDITARKKAEEALRESEERYRDLVENAQDIIYSHDLKGNYTSSNKAGEEITGYTLEESLKLNLTQTVAPEYVDKAREMLTRKLAGENVTAYELDLIAKDGHRVSVEVNTRLVLEDGVPVGVTGIARDITERKTAEAELKRLAAAVEETADSIVITDKDGNIQYVNPAFERVTGYTREEVLNRNPRFLKSGKTDPAVYKELWETITRGDVWTGHLTNRRKDGTFFEERVTISAIYDEAHQIVNYVAVKQDISDLIQLEEQLRQSQKMEAIGQLAGGVAHDFNNLLTAINGYSSLALQRLDDGHPVKSYLEEVKKAGDRATNLTRQLLAFGRKQILQPVALNLNDVVSDLNKMLRRLIGEDIHLTAKLDLDVGKVMADPGQIEQVLVNLIVNARDAMPQGGNLTIETSNQEFDSEYTGGHVGTHPGNYVMLAVSDTGTGMDTETRQHIFEPFFTTKEKGKGTGLGLSTVYGIVKQSGGNIWVYSEPGKGTTFKVYLPRAESKAAQPKEDVVEAVAAGGSETVLLVEDEDIVRGLARRILEQAGYSVVEASKAAEALQFCEEHLEDIDLLLTDVVMPEMSGKELADRLRKKCPELKMLFMSGYTDEAIVHHGVLDSSVEFIQKPFTPGALIKKVRDVLDLDGKDTNGQRPGG